MKKIMIVDDEPDHVRSVRQILEESSDEYKVMGAGSGMECLELLKKNKIPDLVLLDIMMPEMSGWEVVKRLRGNPAWKDIPVVFLTARSDKIAETVGDFYGEDYITKPFDATELKERIDKVFKNTSRRQKDFLL